MKLCKNCNKVYSDNVVFCPDCGGSLEQIEDTLQPENERQEEQTNQNCQQEYKPDPNAQQEYGNYAGRLGFKDAIRICFKEKYACFNGRAKRSEYWYFYLFTALCNIPFQMFYYFMLVVASASHDTDMIDVAYGIYLVCALIIGVIFFLPGLSVTIRRLHDTGRSGAYYFINFIPCAGPFIMLSYLTQASETHDNKYGPYVTVN